MPRSVSTSSRDIDSLPYHALQAEAAKYSIRRNLGSAKLKIAIKRVQETGGDTKDLPREWLTANATESIEVSTGIIPTTLEPRNTNNRKIISKPKPSINSQKQEKVPRLPISRVPSRTIKRITSSDSDVFRKSGTQVSAATNSQEPAKIETSSPLPSNNQSASAGPSVKQNEDLIPTISSQEVSPQGLSSQQTIKPNQPTSVSELEKAICQKALEIGIKGGAPPETVQCLMNIISEVLLGLLSGTALDVAVKNALKLSSRSLLGSEVNSPRSNSNASSNPTPTTSDGQNVEHESQRESVQPAGDLPIDCPGSCVDKNSSKISPQERANSPPDQISIDRKTPSSLRRKIREVDNVETPPMKKTKTCVDDPSSIIEPTDKVNSSEIQQVIKTTDKAEDPSVIHAILSPIKEDPQSKENSPRRTRSIVTSNTLTNAKVLPSTNSKVSINIFPTTHTRFLHKQVKASSGIASPLSKPTLYGTEHMYGHSTAPFGELYDNTDMSFLYELTRPAPEAGSGTSKNQ